MKKNRAAKPNAQKVMQYGFAYAYPLILEAAIKNRVFDFLEKGPMTIEELNMATGASKRGLKAIANALVGMELLRKDGRGRYANSLESSCYLVSTKQSYLGGRFRHAGEQLIPRWLHLADVVKTGKPKISLNDRARGEEYFLSLVPDLFTSNHAAAKVMADYLYKSGKNDMNVLDVAAGSAVWGIVLARKSPRIRVTAFDWPGVLPIAEKTVAREGLEKQFSFVPGDVHKTGFGKGFDVIILGHILHSEGEAAGRKILKKCRRALTPGGRVVIAEWLTDEKKTGPLHSLVFAVNMLVNSDKGDTFSFQEIHSWLKEAGFKKARLLEAPGPSPLIIAEK